MGGAEELLNMLGAAKDDQTRKEALKALVALSPSGEPLLSVTGFSILMKFKPVLERSFNALN